MPDRRTSEGIRLGSMADGCCERGADYRRRTGAAPAIEKASTWKENGMGRT